MTEQDPWLRRIERDAVRGCVVMALLAWAVGRGHLGPPLGVLAGGALVAISYHGIKGGIDATTAASGGAAGATEPAKARKRRRAIGLVKFFTRYAILTAAAYVIIGRLTLPPVAVVAGASSLVAAVGVEAVRYRFGGSRAPSRRGLIDGK